MDKFNTPSDQNSWKFKLHEIVFESETRAGKLFDLGLLIAILLSVGVVMLDSVKSISAEYGTLLRTLEWIFTGIFTLEYILRILSLRSPRLYVFSFLGLIDLLSILPTYFAIFFPGSQAFLVIRILRLLRIFRILKLVHFVGEASILGRALQASKAKIIVFMVVVCSVVTIMGTLMYLVENPENGFTSIPKSIYWAIVTLTTVGYGDIAPQTVLGQTVASFIMILGYGIIAVPTGIITAEFTSIKFKSISNQACPNCSRQGHDPDAKHCKFCGHHL